MIGIYIYTIGKYRLHIGFAAKPYDVGSVLNYLHYVEGEEGTITNRALINQYS